MSDVSVPGPREIPRVRVQDSDTQPRSERKKNNEKFDQQVGTGKEFILFADLNTDEYSNPICEVRMKFEEVNGQRVLKCLEPNCGNPNFGSQFTSSAYHAAVHFRSKHQPLYRSTQKSCAMRTARWDTELALKQ